MSNRYHILLVEDNQDDYEATARSLKKSHFVSPVKWCRSGQDALNYLGYIGSYANDPVVLRPNLVLLDLNLPGIDGRQVLETIKSDSRFRKIPVVILTTSADSKDIDYCYTLGANSYIQKPVNIEGLTEAIRIMTGYWFGAVILP